MASLEVAPELLSTPDAAGFHNASSWYNLTTWTVNVTRYAPSFEDLVWAGPRMFRKLGSFIAVSGPLDGAAGHLDYSYDAGSGLLRPAADSDSNINNIMDTPGAGADPVAQAASRLSMDGARGLGSVFSYATSKWALSCIAMAIILNRTHVFAATRRRLRLRWHLSLALRIAPIFLLVLQARSLLRSIQCQTSPDFAELRWGDASKGSDLMFSHTNSFLNRVSSVLLLGATDAESCTAVSMTPSVDPSASRELRGSLSLLWPLFGSFCLSHFIETVSCAVHGRPVAAETGMTLFEQSLAFAEADAAVSNQLGWGSFSKSQSSEPASSLGSSIALTRSMILKRVNTPPEVLVVAFLAAMTHITSHVLGVFGLQSRYRLVSTGFWGLCFMGTIVWSVFVFDLNDPSTQGLLRYPTVCIIGFAPHVLVLAGIAVCRMIYYMALLLSALSPPANHGLASMTFRQRLVHAHENMQANVSISEIQITREMDFYSALLRVGLAAISMASEAVYLNEDHGVNLKRHTWLEDARFREAEELQRQWIGMGLHGSRFDQIGTIGLIPVKSGPLVSTSGYGRERAAQKIPRGRGERGLRVGSGAHERSSRWLMAFEFVLSITRLLLRLGAMAMVWILGTMRIRARPAWLMWLARRPKTGRDDASGATSKREQAQRRGISALPYNDNGRVPRTDGIDVEAEFRRTSGNADEENLDTDLYKYWLKGGWWGSSDSSGDFVPDPVDDDWDNTSVVSMSTVADGERADDDDDDQWASDESGQRTPTQRSPLRTRENSPAVDSPLNMSDLARLLHPANTEEREQAQALSAHLQSGNIMTRSTYRRLEQLKRTRILTASGSGASSGPSAAIGMPGRTLKLSLDEEERLLEQLLLSRRQEASPPADADGTQWDQGAAGMGGDGPQCVVCQSSPRTIIVWPCRCLSLCDDCRVSLAMNNFDKCVCCRREVISFSRIFVP